MRVTKAPSEQQGNPDEVGKEHQGGHGENGQTAAEVFGRIDYRIIMHFATHRLDPQAREPVDQQEGNAP